MKKLLTTLSIAVGVHALSLGVQPVSAQEDKTPSAFNVADEEQDNLWVTLSLPFYNKYYYRGIELYSDTSFQPSVSVNYGLGDYGTIGASVWAHIPMADDQVRINGFDSMGNAFSGEIANKFVEVDPAINYDLPVGIATLSVGHIWYTDPSEGSTEIIQGGQRIDVGPAAPDTSEYYGGIALDTIAQPSLTVYHDYREFDSQYYALGFSQFLDEEQLGTVLGEGFNITPYALLGFVTNGEKIYNKKSGLKHINVGVSSTLSLGIIRVTPRVQYNFGFDDDINDIERTDNDFIFGVDFAYDGSYALF